nr:MAG TPA: hypothetical protein [Caudoviricetes sp.]
MKDSYRGGISCLLYILCFISFFLLGGLYGD